MGYGFGFLLSLVRLPPKLENITEDDVESFVKEIATVCKQLHKQSAWFPEIGVKDHAGSGSYSCGDQEKLLPEMLKLAVKFPDTVFAIYHYYWDYSLLSVFTFSDKGLLRHDECSIEDFKVGPYTTSTAFDFDHTTIPNNITIHINEDYGYEFNWQGSIELPKQETKIVKKSNNITFGELYNKYRYSTEMYDLVKEENMFSIFKEFDFIASGVITSAPNNKNLEIVCLMPWGIMINLGINLEEESYHEKDMMLIRECKLAQLWNVTVDIKNWQNLYEEHDMKNPVSEYDIYKLILKQLV